MGTSGPLIVVCMVIIASNLTSNVFKYLANKILHTVRFILIRKLKNELFNKLINMEVSYFSNERKGDLLTRFTFDMINIEQLTTDTLKAFIRDPFTLLFYLGFLIFMSWKLTLIAAVILPIGGTLISLISKKLRKQAQIINDTNGEMISVTEESFTGLRVIKSFTSEIFVGKRYDDINAINTNERRKHDTRVDLSSSLSEVFGIFMIALILFIGGNIVLSNSQEIKASEFIAYIGLFSQIIVPAKSLINCIGVIQKGLVSATKIFEIIDRKETILDAPDAVDIKSIQQSIEIKNLNFKYGERTVLKNINMTILKGQTIALVGPSGSGKSTLADLISRFYEVEEGEILFDGINIKKIRQQSLREKIGIVAQEAVLFNDTIYNNIAFSKENTSFEKLEIAAKAANAHEFIIKTEKQYQTNIGDRGNKLSGGQKQRLSIARALLKNPEILILDEATSALDTESERLVQEALNNLMSNRTSIVIAHRLSTIVNADVIFVLNEGEIVEYGNHNTLMSNKGLYFKLVSLQNNSQA